jgi:hypothetical protein
VPTKFARQEYLSKSAQGWRSGYGNPITSWEHHVQARWESHERKRTRGTTRNGQALHPAVLLKQLTEVRT